MSEARIKGPRRNPPVDYPPATEGSRTAAEARAACNKLSDEEQARSGREAMKIIYAGRRRPKAVRA